MNKKPVISRTIAALVVILVFAVSIYPLTERDFYDTFDSLLKKRDDKVAELVKLAKEKQVESKGQMFGSVAIEEAAGDLNIDLTEYVKGQNLVNNRDAISWVRQNARGSIRLGLDLAGGVEFMLELVPDTEGTKDGKAPEALSQTNFNRYRDIAIETLRNRLEQRNIFESEISPAGSGYISLKVPVVAKDDKERLLNLIQMSAKLDFRLVHPENDSLVTEFTNNPTGFVPPVGYERLTLAQADKKGKIKESPCFVEIKKQMDGSGIVSAFPSIDELGQRRINLEFNTDGANEFSEVTRANVGRRLGIVLDGKLYSAPSIRGAIDGGHAVIEGSFTNEEAQTISDALVSGSLPVRINVNAVFDTDPTLGKASVSTSAWAGAIALLAVMLFMVAYYLLPGLIADIALLINVVMVLGALAAFDATLTLPGIAGIILTVGMSVDANVLIFERIREELGKGKTLLNAIDLGYSRAFTTILDANLTTLFTALILMWQGTGAIKGFAVTLSIGIATSMFTALFLTRLLFDVLTRTANLKTLKMWQFFSQPKIDFLGMRFAAAVLSAILVVGAIVVAGVRGADSLGVDFTGGTQMLLNYGERIPVSDVEGVLRKMGFDNTKVAYKSSADDKKLSILIRERDIASESAAEKAVSPMAKVTAELNKSFPKAGFSGGQEASLGGLIGWEFSKSAIIAMVMALVGIVIYISLRFEFAYAVASIVALVHDVIIATGIYLVCGRELSLPVIAALLTIIGYSLNDTIVVFDRIREDLSLIKDKSYKQIINLSINQTLSRTLLTSLTTILVLLVLFIFGGVSINNFVFVMLTGVIVGTYSSIFVASPIVAVWHKRLRGGVKDKLPAKGETAAKA